jgi:histidinol-phosphatase (PHP family)
MKTDYHIHTVFCDGHDTPEAMAQAARDKHFDIIGFSAHTMYPFADTYHVPPNQLKDYVAAIETLKAKYRGTMEILTGFEVEYVPPFCVPDKAKFAALGADYTIGSVHYITGKDMCFAADGKADEVARGIETLFQGDGKKAVQTYFALERAMLTRGGFDILGHADVIRKRNRVLRFFDETEGWYGRELEATAKAAARSGVVVEINTGAITRGAMDDVYPSAAFLRLLHKHNVPVMINSDAHKTSHLDTAFDLAKQRAKDAGYTEAVYLQEGGKIRTCPL